MKPMKIEELSLDCALDVVASELEQFWSTHEYLSDLSLRRVDGPPMRREYRIIELLTNVYCTHRPRCPVEHEEHQRADLTFTMHRWNPERTRLVMHIYPPSPNADGVIFAGKGCYPPFPEEILEEIPERFSAHLEQQGLVPPTESEPDSSAVKAEAPEKQEADPWTKIPDHDWDRPAVRMLHEGCTSREIAHEIGKGIVAKTVDNRLSVLRGLYGTEIVPYRKQGPQKLG